MKTLFFRSKLWVSWKTWDFFSRAGEVFLVIDILCYTTKSQFASFTREFNLHFCKQFSRIRCHLRNIYRPEINFSTFLFTHSNQLFEFRDKCYAIPISNGLTPRPIHFILHSMWSVFFNSSLYGWVDELIRELSKIVFDVLGAWGLMPRALTMAHICIENTCRITRRNTDTDIQWGDG